MTYYTSKMGYQEAFRMTVTPPNVSAGTKSILANISDPYMGRIELVEITPESLHQQAIQSWR